MKKLIIVLMMMCIASLGLVIAFTQINHIINFDKEKKDTLTSIGINEPVISSCIKIDDYKCKSNIYQKGGINKDIEIITKYCEEYEIEFYDGDCLNYSYSEEQGDCLNWTDENQTICSEYEIIQIQGNCTSYETLNRTTNECKTWKILTQQEIETEMKIKTESLLLRIVDIQEKRDEVKIDEYLTDKLNLNIN